MTDSAPTVPFFKKGKSRPTTNRKRSVSPAPADARNPVKAPSKVGDSSLNAIEKSQVVLPSRKQAANILSAGTKRTASQRDEEGNESDREGPDVKWTAAGSHQQAAQDILDGDEAEELLAKRARQNTKDDDDEHPEDGLYHGQKGYKSHLVKNKEIPKAMRVGPQRSTNTIKTVTLVDYQPDVCKDYKETGYCGFGDTCKFLHDRGTYLQGWQLDKLAADPKKQIGDDSSDSDSDEDIPFACLICRNPFTDPVVTRCGHYFCSACAIKRFAKTPKCLACGAPTGGIFNRAEKVIAKLKAKKKAREDQGDDSATEDAQAGGIEVEGLREAKNDSSSDSEDESG